MKRFLLATVLVTIAVPVFADHVGMSVNIGQPGFYGQIDIGNFPRPAVIYPAPVIIQSVPMGMVPQPIYLRVPPTHRSNWGRHCHRYGACGQPVYFVQDNWYNNVYVPGYYDYRGGWGGYRGYYDGRGYDRGDHHHHHRGHGRGDNDWD